MGKMISRLLEKVTDVLLFSNIGLGLLLMTGHGGLADKAAVAIFSLLVILISFRLFHDKN